MKRYFNYLFTSVFFVSAITFLNLSFESESVVYKMFNYFTCIILLTNGMYNLIDTVKEHLKEHKQ